jgi:hypothetical protein
VVTVTVMSDRDSRLPPRAEALLSAFSIPERDFEAMEERVRAQIAQTTIGSTPAALLEAPLPAESGEQEGAAAASSPTTRLSDLARAVAHKKVDAAADAEIARETLSVANKLRSQTDVLLERMRAAPRSAEPPLRPRAVPVADDAAAPATPVRLPPPPLAPASQRPPAAAATASKSSRRFAWIGGAGLSLAAAAALIVLVRQPGDGQESVPVAAVQAPDEAKARQAAPAPPQAATPAATATLETGAAPPLAEPAAAPKEPVSDDSAIAAKAPTVSARPMSGGAAAPVKRLARGEKVVLEETPSSGRKPGYEPAPAAAENELKPAAGKTADGLLPDKPSTGAVQAAIASVMTGARACVAGADAPIPATVMFGSNGAVKSVVVSGAAQGSPAGKCIQSALGRAKVAPFAQNTFSVGVSVRP